MRYKMAAVLSINTNQSPYLEFNRLVIHQPIKFKSSYENMHFELNLNDDHVESLDAFINVSKYAIVKKNMYSISTTHDFK